MEVRKIMVVLCLCVVFGSAIGKRAKSKPENLEDTYGALGEEDDEGVQNDDYDYGTGDPDSAPDEENNVVAAEEHVEFITPPGVFVANIGDTLKLPCEVSNTDIVMIWQKDDTLLFQGGVPVEKIENIEEIDNSTLKIKILSNADYGNYACVLMTTNDVKSRPKIIHRIVAATPPVIQGILTNKNNKTVYKVGDTLSLTCVATGNPKPTISWHKGSERLAITGETLIITNITADNDGIYRCLADNQVATQGHHKPSHSHIYIQIEHLPKLSVKEYIVTANKEKNAELTCTADAFPQAEIQWKKGDEIIVNGGKNKITLKRKEKVLESILLISDLSEEDFTTYTCSAENSVGNSDKKINLVKVPVVREFNKPDKANRDVVLTWKVESTSPVTAHEIQYRKKGETVWKEAKPEVTVTGSNIFTVRYTLKDLDAGAYETRVRTQSEHGWSEYSDIMPFEGVSAKHGSSTHKNHHKKHHKDQKEKELKEKHVQEVTPVPEQQEIIQKEAPVGASQTSSSSSMTSSLIILSIALTFLFSNRQ